MIGVFWDVDGTLSNSYQLGFTCTNEVLRRHGLPPIDELTYHQGTKYTTPRRMAWHATNDPDNDIGMTLGQQFDDLYVDFVSADSTPLYPGIFELLHKIKDKQPNVAFAALSNACTQYVRSVLKCTQLEPLFSLSLGADIVPRAKPDPDGLLQICKSLSIATDRCVYIGDSPTDGQAAKAAGMMSIGVTWGSHPAQVVRENFQVVVANVDDLHRAILSFVSSISYTE